MNAIETTDRMLQEAALKRLLRVARSDTGQSKRVADFLLAWWNARMCGGFDLTDLWGLDESLAEDALTVLRLMLETRAYPDTLGYAEEFAELIRAWRPHLLIESA